MWHLWRIFELFSPYLHLSQQFMSSFQHSDVKMEGVVLPLSQTFLRGLKRARRQLNEKPLQRSSINNAPYVILITDLLIILLIQLTWNMGQVSLNIWLLPVGSVGTYYITSNDKEWVDFTFLRKQRNLKVFFSL